MELRQERLDWLSGGGQMSNVVRSLDWSCTPLGPIEGWSQSLRTTVSLCLASTFPISIAWGPEHTQIYNDGYWPICGAKHPRSMGQNFAECWASAWPVIGQAFERALEGQTSFLENQRMFLDRNGYLEETFFTFSFSPIRDETGAVAGLFHPVTETTAKMLSERRTRALRDLAARAGKAQTVDEACELTARTLAEYDLDLPFTLIYLADADGERARLAGRSGLRDGESAPLEVALGAGAPSDPLRTAARSGRAVDIDDVQGLLGPLDCGPYPEPVARAVALPLTVSGVDRPAGVVVAGLSPRLPLDEEYRGFLEMLASSISAVITGARAYELERKRAETLAELDRAKTAFFSNVSHEFRTPLTLILGPVEDALAQPGGALSAEPLQAVHRSSVRLLRLVNSLLDFARLEAGRLELSFEPTDLGSFTADLASSFRSLAERAGLRLVVDSPPTPRPVYVDRAQWEKIVLNLLSNAFKFTFRGEIRVAVTATQSSATLTVSDTGTGIPDPELPRIFDRFYRVQGAAGRSFEGSGIGLALVQELVRLHGGTIDVRSTLGEGTTFSVTVAAGDAHVPEEQRSSATRAFVAGGAGTSPYLIEAKEWLPGTSSERRPALARTGAVEPGPVRAGRVLVVDDNHDMREYLLRLLAPLYEVRAAADGQAALETTATWLPDLVLSDVMMPRLDGFALLRHLRAGAETNMVPVILLSARAGDEAVIEGLESGADDYLIKPFSARELLARVRTQLEMVRMRRVAAEAAERERSQAVLRFLADATAALVESLDYQTTMARVASLAVPTLADLCFLDVVDENGVVERVSVACADASLADQAAELKRFGPGRLDGRGTGGVTPAGRALRESQPILIDELTDERLRAISQDEEHASLLRSLKIRSMLAIPLVARRRTVGIMTLATSGSRRRFSAADLSLAQELASRSAMAMDNARLYKDSQDSIRVRDEFICVASHELKTPLTPLGLLLHAVQRRVADADAGAVPPDWLAGKLATVVRQSQRIERLVDELLDVSRISAKRLLLELRPVDLSRLVRNVRDRLAETGDPSVLGGLLQLRVQDGVVGRWDAQRLEQVATNLILNALKFGAERPVDVSLTADAHHAVLTVSDQGIGIAPEDQSRIFSRFERAVSVRNFGGLGLGLFISRQVVEALGGSISVRSELGSGATFTVSLPIDGPMDFSTPTTVPAATTLSRDQIS